ncbi:MAG TPA: glycoside hydrolase family 15 protein, partial [Planctomycetaceae bacterium]|nr:glycoside hydrolase family 15 protein [Planctomycetaceae bacterium]
MSKPIEDYAMIGDFHTAALVARDGSIDWLCLPRFDSGACFASLLGTPDNGYWIISPSSEVRRVNRQYRPGTLVLETEFETEEGVVTLIDCMPPRTQEPDVLRAVVGKQGRVPMRMKYVPRFDYGSITPWVRTTDDGLLAIAGPDSLLLRTPVETRGEGLTTVAEFTVAAGETVPFSLMYFAIGEETPKPLDVMRTIDEVTERWQHWSGQCTYTGPYRDAVQRSLITLKALTYRPTGGIVAAVTTSLPEKLGGVRNWDYRFCWLRDASLTLTALVRGGYHTEAGEWRRWLLRAVAGNASQLNIMYGLRGERRLTEIELDWLDGYADSKPVRSGNDAHRQFQLDVFGELLNALYVAEQAGLEPEEDSWNVLLKLMEYLEKAWQEPDDGIWEVRGPRRHFTHSKVMAWVAFDRMLQMHDAAGDSDAIARWSSVRDQIHAQVCDQGFDRKQNSFVQYYGGEELDASLLMIPMVGFLPADDPRMVGTVEAISKQLKSDGFIKRYRSNEEVEHLPPGEGAFLPCTFWLADNLALQGRADEARDIFERLLGLRNDVGLLSEEYDTEQLRLLGNFPQAFSHVSLVNCACNLGE